MDSKLLIVLLVVGSKSAPQSHAPETVCDEACIGSEACQLLSVTSSLTASVSPATLAVKVRLTNPLSDSNHTLDHKIAEKMVTDASHFCGQRARLAHVEAGFFRKLGRLTEINLNNNRLTKIDASTFGGLPRLSHLHVSDNYIEHIAPDAFEAHSLLHCISFRNNKLQYLNLRLSSRELEWIDFGSNKLMVFSLVFLNGCCSRLERLSLQGNLLKTISVENAVVEGLYLKNNHLCLAFLQQRWYERLQYLGISANRLQSFTFDSLSGLPQLTHLDLSSNLLSRFDVGRIAQFPLLVWIGLNDNLLLDLEVEKLPERSCLHVAGNLFSCTRLEEMLQHGNVFGYSENRKTFEPQKYYEHFVRGIRCIKEDVISGKDMFALIQPASRLPENACSPKFLNRAEALQLGSKANKTTVPLSGLISLLLLATINRLRL